MESKRQVNIEALRTLAMFMIVVYHYIFYGLKGNPYHQYYDMTSFKDIVNYVTMEPLYIISGVSVNCFVMITGYFLIEKMDFRWKGALNIWIQTFFYSVLFLIVFYLGGSELVNRESIAASFFPVYNKSYWFVTTYMGLVVIAPFLAKMAQSLSKHQYQLMLIILFILSFEYLYGKIYSGARSILWFSFLFLIAGYIKLYQLPSFIVNNRGKIISLLLFIMFVFGSLINLYHGSLFQLISTNYHGGLFFLSFSVFVYFVFAESPNKFFRVLAAVSPYTFGVYLIHSNMFIQYYIWELVVPDYFDYPVIFYCLFTSMLIFGLCSIIDLMRFRFFSVLHINNRITHLTNRLPQL